jgi:hypothetical protein
VLPVRCGLYLCAPYGSDSKELRSSARTPVAPAAGSSEVASRLLWFVWLPSCVFRGQASNLVQPIVCYLKRRKFPAFKIKHPSGRDIQHEKFSLDELQTGRPRNRGSIPGKGKKVFSRQHRDLF